MTLADLIQPCSTILLHANLKGIQLGAGFSAALSLPLLSIRPSLVNPNSDPPLVAIAKTAGKGALLGTVAATTAATVRMVKLTKVEIESRSEKLHASDEERHLKKVAAVGSGIGIGLIGVRFSQLAKESGKTVREVTLTSDGMWEVFCFGVLGAGVAVGAVKVGKAVVEVVKKKKGGEGGDGAVVDAAEAVEGAVEGTVATEGGEGGKGDEAQGVQGQ